MAFNVDQSLLATIQANANKLALDPSNVPLRTTILKDQVALTSKQLNISTSDAGSVVKNYTAAYAKTKGADPQAVLDALSADEQKILNYSADNPTFAGLDISTANKIASFAASGSLVLFVGGLVAAIAAIISIGPEAAAAAIAGDGLVSVLANAFKVPQLKTAIVLFAMAGTLEAFSLAVPMITKQMIDNGSIGPGLRISALKEAEDLKSKLSGTSTPGSFTASQFTDYASALEVNGIGGINDPCKAQTVIYSRKALADLISCVYGKAVSTGGGTTVTKLIPQLAPYLIVNGVSGSGAVAPATVVHTASSAPTSTKVFTGVVSGGVVGEGLTFTARPSDLIQSMADLQQAINNNVSPYLAALLGKITYEVRVVNSVLINGIRKTGQSQRVQSGISKTGVPTYKTVMNKFAVVELYFIKDGGARTKLTTIVLGPTNALSFSPSGNDLSVLADNISGNILTTSTDDISKVVTNTPTLIAPPQAPVKQVTTTGGYLLVLTSGARYTGNLLSNGVFVADNPPDGSSIDAFIMNNPTASGRASVTFIGSTTSAPGTVQNNGSTSSNGAGASPPSASASSKGSVTPAPISPAPSLPTTALTAQTLFDFYSAYGRSLPTLTDRGNLYQSLGLGQAAFYTGTAEQNTRLLSALKAKGI